MSLFTKENLAPKGHYVLVEIEGVFEIGDFIKIKEGPWCLIEEIRKYSNQIWFLCLSENSKKDFILMTSVDQFCKKGWERI